MKRFPSLPFLVSDCAIPNVSFGQNSKAAWRNVQRLKAGNTTRVIQMNSPDIHWKFLRASPEEVSIQIDKNEISVQRADVQRFDVKRGYKAYFMP